MTVESKGRELFIVDNSVSGWTGLRYLEEWSSIAKAFDIATGYFEISALVTLDGRWQGLDKIRILMGAETTHRTRKAILEAVRAQALTRLDESIEEDKEPNPFLDKFVGNVFEKAIYLACGAKFSSVYEGVHYNVGKKDYEIDVAAKSGRHVILIETKAKMLTSESRTVDMMAFLKDYTNSYLKLLKQLVRHDRNLTKGITPLTGSGEDTSNLHVTKIAVSPLSFGPSSDKTLANALLCSVANARFKTKTGDPIHAAVVDGLNAAIEEIGGLIKEDDQDDLFGYMMGVIWLDIGQLLYVLKRCRSLDQLLSPIGNITTGSQDFWTEVANADRWGLSKNKWYPPGSGDTRQS